MIIDSMTLISENESELKTEISLWPTDATMSLPQTIEAITISNVCYLFFNIPVVVLMLDTDILTPDWRN